MKNPNVSAIVPVFNEEKTIAKVVSCLLKSSFIDEVICINDGSKDKSLTILKSFDKRIVLINLKKNYGKGYALAQGIKKANGSIVAFFDGDLINFSNRHIKKLITPLLQNGVRGVLGYQTKGRYFPRWVNNITGTRAYYKADLLPHLKYLAKTGFGVEMYLHYAYKNKVIKKVHLRNLDHVWKHQKHSSGQALKGYAKLIAEVTRELSLPF